jgi:hypothetical protein
VRTNIPNAESHRPERLRDETRPVSAAMQAGRGTFEALIAAGMPPAQVAKIVFDAIRKEQFYILTEAKWMEAIRLRTERLMVMENPENPSAVLGTILKHA